MKNAGLKDEIVKEKKPILRNRTYLYLTEFFSGMSVMAVELGASRLMAPYFSSSQIVWTIIIGTIMIAMALGNIYGGRSADKNPDPDKLYGRIIIAAIWIALIPVVGKYIILGISALLIFTVSSNFLIIAGFVACMVIFVFPLFLLGLLAIIYFVSGKPTASEVRKISCGIVLFILCAVLGHNNSFAFWQNDLLYEGESIYNYLQVYDNDEEVVLSTNVLFGVQSVYKKQSGLTGMYYDYAMAAPYMSGVKEKPEMDILVLGNGTGTYATQCNRYFDNVKIDGVEIDQKITDLAKEYFELPDDVKVTTYDGRAYLNAIDDKYDVIMVDAYQDITIPFQMSSIEFFDLVKEHLKEDGVMVVNMNMRGSEEGNINQYLADTISEIFGEVYTADVSGSTNRELFASNNADMLKVYEANLAQEDNKQMQNMMQKVSSDLVAYEAGDYIMTDDRAPVELLGMKVIDELIKDEVGYYKQIYKEGGVKALLKML